MISLIINNISNHKIKINIKYKYNTKTSAKAEAKGKAAGSQKKIKFTVEGVVEKKRSEKRRKIRAEKRGLSRKKIISLQKENDNRETCYTTF
ncbi:MAG: hypothetical protein MJZ15_09645 [Bacteroidales bacterium]|nr:hypothetical protein [Bacteroidales bacterium]